MNFKKTILKILISAAIISLPCAAKADIYKDNHIPNDVKTKIEKIVDEPSHLDGIDDFKRKPREKRIRDNIRWYKKHGKVDDHYNKYCLDIENFGDPDDFVDLRTGFKHQEKSDPSKRTFSTADKLSLYSAVNQKYKYLNTPVYFRFKGGNLLNFKYSKIKDCSKTLFAFRKLPDGKFFIKPQRDSLGKDAIVLVKEGKKLDFTHVTQGKIGLKEFFEITQNKAFFVQDFIEQHEDLKVLNPSSLNTIRIITTKFNDKAQILCAGLRMGQNTKTIVDNASKGGCFVGIDEKTGKLQKYGFFSKSRAVKEHPESKIKFENYQIPFWKECVDTAKKLQMMSPGYTSIGWDIAITPKGPVLIEGNSKWGEFIPNLTCRGIRKKWEHNKRI
ncbi:MAG: hypothetical protein IKE05_05400 [Clostridia bacterium]|nr:hypothetical protein [Clostridia bacterium]